MGRGHYGAVRLSTSFVKVEDIHGVIFHSRHLKSSLVIRHLDSLFPLFDKAVLAIAWSPVSDLEIFITLNAAESNEERCQVQFLCIPLDPIVPTHDAVSRCPQPMSWSCLCDKKNRTDGVERHFRDA